MSRQARADLEQRRILSNALRIAQDALRAVPDVGNRGCIGECESATNRHEGLEAFVTKALADIGRVLGEP